MHISAKCSVAAHCLLFIAAFQDDCRVTGALLARSTGCNPAAVRSVLSGLKKAGLISVARGRGGARLLPAPEDVTLLQIYEAVCPQEKAIIGLHPSPSARCPVGRSIYAVLEDPYAQVLRAAKEGMRAVTLAQLLERYRLFSSQETDAQEEL